MWMPTAGARPARGRAKIHRATVVPAPLADTFAFFADASNLEWLTPEWLGLRIVTPLPVVMREGLELDYRIAVYGVPLPWRSRIDVWEPGVRFVDRQVVGPYRWWRHEHWFEATSSGTRVVDDVEYVPRLHWMTARLVHADLEHIFDHRQERLQHHFAAIGRTH